MIEEIHTYRITCEEAGSCGDEDTIVVQATDEYDASRQAELKGWLVVPRVFEGASDDGPYMCPKHFQEAIPHWERVNYNPHWLRLHPLRRKESRP